MSLQVQHFGSWASTAAATPLCMAASDAYALYTARHHVVVTYRLESGSAHVAILALGALLAGGAGRNVRVVGLLAVGHCGGSGCRRRVI